MDHQFRKSALTVVTALYDIGRESQDGRTFQQYLDWFADTLRLPVAMVVFVEPTLRSFVEDRRKSMNSRTLIVTAPLQEIPCYGLLPQIEQAMDQWHADHQTSRMSKQIDLCLRLPLYNVVIYSKFGWIHRAMELDPFQSSVWMWLDAGASRFFRPSISKLFPETKKRDRWPGRGWLKRIYRSRQTWLSGVELMRPYLEKQQVLEEKSLIGTSRPLLLATAFAAEKHVLRKLAADTLHCLETILADSKIDTEQVMLAVLWSRTPERFQVMMDKDLWVNKLGKAAIKSNAAAKVSPSG